MCGITGYYAINKRCLANLAKVEDSADKLLLRGPDQGSFLQDGPVALGHRRLSIIDTSVAACQPMKDSTGRYILAFNGEIFNYRELSDTYLKDTWALKGGPATTSDTEILLELLVQYGTKCLPWLSGFFAFAFYDRETRAMIIARDRYGKKPLLYYTDGDYFAFASEMKALLAYDIPQDMNYDAVFTYFQLHYLPTQQSIIKGVKKLPPGSWLSVSAKGVTAPEAYYTLAAHPEKYAAFTYEAAKDKLVTLMDASVKERMIADVPLGAFLSGGIDSSVIVALASRHTTQLNTFSIGYKDHAFFDETKYARLVASRYKTNHTVFSLGNDDFLENLHDMLAYIDEPFADPSALPLYILSKLTRKHVTVALSGDGGDELFAGYTKHAAELRARSSSGINTLVKAAHPVLSMLPKGRDGRFTNKIRQVHRFAEGLKLSAAERYWRWASINTETEVAALLSQKANAQVDKTSLANLKRTLVASIKTDDLNELLVADMNMVLPGDMLPKVDLMSMANSLEVRSPFLDYKVVEFAFSIPQAYKINSQLKKRIVQDAFRPMLPEELYNRPKQGFDIPMQQWFRNELRSFIFDDLLAPAFIREQQLFEPESILVLKQQLFSGNPGESVNTIWALIVFQSWYKKYFNAA